MGSPVSCELRAYEHQEDGELADRSFGMQRSIILICSSDRILEPRFSMIASSRSRKIVLACGLMAAFACSGQVRAEQVKVSPSISVTKRSFHAPINEQPFFGFVVKNAAEVAADSKFIAAIEEAGSREAGALHVERRGWEAVQAGDLATAARRFNQAWLLAPGRSPTVHGFAIVASERFQARDYADELFTLAASLLSPLPTLEGDHARLYLLMKRPEKAIPLLRKAVAKANNVTFHVNLAAALYQTGDIKGACLSVRDADRFIGQIRQTQPNATFGGLEQDLRSLRIAARCEPT